MKLSLNNFLYGVKQIVMGGGAGANDGGYLVDGSPESSFTSVVLNAAASPLAAIMYHVPRDYDEATDVLTLDLVAAMGGATDTPVLTVAVTRKRIGAADVVLVTGAAVGTLGTTLQRFENDLTGNSLVRDDILKIVYSAAAHGTDAIVDFLTSVSYRSTLVSYNEEDAAGNELR